MEEQLQPFVGRWELVRSEQFDEFLVEMGFGSFFRKMAGMSSPINEIKVKDGVATFAIIVARFYRNELVVKLGQEFEQLSEKIMYKFKTWFENGRFTIDMTPVDPNGKGKKQVIHREIINDELVMTIHVNNVKCVRAYKREGKK